VATLKRMGWQVWSGLYSEGNEIKIHKRINPTFKSITQIKNEESITEKEVYYKYVDKIFTTAMPQSSIRIRVQEVLGNLNGNDILFSIEYVPRSGRNKGNLYEQFYKGAKLRLLSWLKDVAEVKDGKIYKKELQGTYWDGFNLNNLSKEGKVQLENGKKPEALLERIIDMATNKDDIVLDFFAGSGTTCAVAHKMGIRYIGIEQLDYEENDCLVRLKNVVHGDASGISDITKWSGGGEFIYCELMKFNEKYFEEIKKAKTSKELNNIWNDIKNNSFISYKVDVKTFDENANKFNELSIENQKKVLLETLDKNQLYVNLSEIDDKEYDISKENKELNSQFYKLK